MDTTTDTSVGGVIVTPSRTPWRRRRVPGALAWVAVTPFAAWAVWRLAGLERGSFPAQIMTATPYAAAGSLLPLLLALLSRRRAVTAVAVAASAALGLSVLPRAFGETTPSGRPFTMLTANLFFGHGDAATVVDLVRRHRPDVLNTQELTPAAVADLDAAGLKELMPYRVLEDEWSAAGSGIFSSHPISRLDGLFQVIGHNMPAARLDLPGGPSLEIVDVHTLPPLGRQVAQWTDGLRALPSGPASGPLRVLAGDFNASLDHAEMRKLVARGYRDAGDATGGGLTPTWPANKRLPPLITIDHVLADHRVGFRAYKVFDVPGTDHRAVLAELTLPVSG
ncbi:endonuclease [Sphaerisporangium siamense]|uniref:Endonuclease/exonuclease/phosphatase (EEP) superfamily protein YafD n=1 Tax=Sphaerisporangium siamense TaxID=795645 RepID=A0A7W7G9X9_9ACTN|nr:endonuclease/exonuclease/phosphatase family protein [Sphaerisporangium siamense]MBB4701110.1 endonuclease/exonuclease/phosphatase (EEP) superfamily protein YafD [Sphaerisporangium siamense]GII89349.1 endonuclease [Sphaerisporangium siamense]